MHDELTRVDIRKMQEEIDYRKSEITPKLKEQLKAARDLGDLSENDEYHSVKRALNKNYGRIRYLQAMITMKRFIIKEVIYGKKFSKWNKYYN